MTLADQAARRIEMARAIGAEPRRWIVTREAEMDLIAAADPAAWSADGALLHGIPIEHGRPRSNWGLDLELVTRSPRDA